ncbi:MAG: YigZ family protein [bacterium]
MDANKLNTIPVPGEYKLKEKGSVFTALSHPIDSGNQFIEIYSTIKKKYYDATHHCYAYKLYGGKEKYSDDGEPTGTAGIRILNAINHFTLTNVAVIIVRYFGGTKLGVGPLGKAYYNSALGVLSAEEFIEKTKYTFYRINFEYDLTSMVHHQLKEFEATEIINKFEKRPIVECAVISDRAESFIANLKDNSKGKVSIEYLEDRFLI